MSNERDAENDREREVRVAIRVHEIAEIINAGEVEGRAGLRDIAISLLRDEVRATEPSVEAAVLPPASFNPFGIGIPLFLMGGVMVFLFPPVGLLMFGVAALMIAWGVGTTLLARR